MNKLSFEYDMDESKKRLKKQEVERERFSKIPTSLDTKYEQRVLNLKDKQNQLNKILDLNSDYYVRYKNDNYNDRIGKYQEMCFNPNPRNSPYSLQLSSQNQNDQQQAIQSDQCNTNKTQQAQSFIPDRYQENDKNIDIERYKIKQIEYNQNPALYQEPIENINNNFIESGAYNNVSNLTENITTHNPINKKNLDEINQKYRDEHIALSRSILDFNKEQADIRYNNKRQEEDNKKFLNEERRKELERMNKEKNEFNLMKQYKQNSYKSILDMQAGYNNKFGDNLSNNPVKPHNGNTFKFYSGAKNYNLGDTSLDHNPIINPVNSYSFAKYYIRKHNLQ